MPDIDNSTELDGDSSPVEIVSPSALEAIQRAEIDIAIATAHKFPRDIATSIRHCEAMALRNAKIAGRCNYALPRAGKKIVGPSVHFARIVLPCWRNTTAIARVIGADRENAHLQGVCHDLETNTRIGFEMDWPVQPPKTETPERWKDQINLAKRAGMAVAFRTAVFNVVPMVLFEDIVEKAKQVALGEGKSYADKRNNAIAILKEEMGITQPMIYKALEVGGLESITADHLIWLNAALQSIRDGVMTKEEVFGSPQDPVKAQVPKRTRNVTPEVVKEPEKPAEEPQKSEPKKPKAEPQNLFPKLEEDGLREQLISKLMDARVEFKDFANWLQSIGAVSSLPAKVTDLRPTLLAQAVDNWDANIIALRKWQEESNIERPF